MTLPTARFAPVKIERDIITIVGGLGSGKSEIAVNLARQLAAAGPKSVAIADLDIHNPYFRSREAAQELANFGIRSLIPPGKQVHADLPIIIPGIQAEIRNPKGRLIIDVGGDDTGARVLSSLADAFATTQYELLLVLNANRPFTETTEQALQMIRQIEASTRLTFTGIISNAHLMENTSVDTIMTGLALAEQVCKARDLPIVCVVATLDLASELDPSSIDYPLLVLDRSLLKPWERKV